MSLQLLHLLQLADSAFPTGAFAHSLGLETLAQEGWIGVGAGEPAALREQSLLSLLAARLQIEVARGDLPCLLRAHTLSRLSDLEGLVHLDRSAAALRAPREWREAGARAGRRLIAAVADVAADEFLDRLTSSDRVRTGGLQFAVAFGVAGAVLDCAAEPTALAYTSTTCAAHLAAAVRLGLVGQRGVQRMLHRLKPAMLAAVAHAASLPFEEAGGTLPLVEIAGMRHEQTPERLFIS